VGVEPLQADSALELMQVVNVHANEYIYQSKWIKGRIANLYVINKNIQHHPSYILKKVGNLGFPDSLLNYWYL
jgi:hypothetical protein